MLKRRLSSKPFIKREPNNACLVSGLQIKGVTSCLVSNLERVFQYVIVLIRSLKNGFGNGVVEYIYVTLQEYRYFPSPRSYCLHIRYRVEDRKGGSFVKLNNQIVLISVQTTL